MVGSWRSRAQLALVGAVVVGLALWAYPIVGDSSGAIAGVSPEGGVIGSGTLTTCNLPQINADVASRGKDGQDTTTGSTGADGSPGAPGSNGFAGAASDPDWN